MTDGKFIPCKPPSYPSGFCKSLLVSSPSAFKPETKIGNGAESPYPEDHSEPVEVPNRTHVPVNIPPKSFPKSVVLPRGY